jgi:Zn-finger nucleic acid-binding protein
VQNCPDCHHDLVEVTFKSEKGGDIHCFYCSHCGGSFFEHWDSNLLGLNEIKKDLEKVFFQEEEVEKINVEPTCPFDQSMMRPVMSEAVPRGVRIFFCPTCKGNWFPKAELVRFKQSQEKKVFSFKSLNIPMASISSVFLPVLFVMFIFGSAVIAGRSFMSSKTIQQINVGAISVFQMMQIKSISTSSVEISFFTDEVVKTTFNYKKSESAEVLSETEKDFSRYHYFVIRNLENPKVYLFQLQGVNLNGKVYASQWMGAK